MTIDYSPKTISDFVFGSPTSQNKVMSIIGGSLPFPSTGITGILLYGSFGTGKSELAKFLPGAIEALHGGNHPYYRYEEIQRGNDGARIIQSIQTQLNIVPYPNRYHYIVLDEVDNLNRETMPSLKALMNTKESVFILTTNNITKVEGGVLDRCHCIEFNAAKPEQWLPMVKRILRDQKKLTPPDEMILPIIAQCNGSARRIINSAFELAEKCANIQMAG